MNKNKSIILILLLVFLPIMVVTAGTIFPSKSSLRGLEIFKEEGIANKLFKGDNLTEKEIDFLKQSECKFITSRISGIRWKEPEKARSIYEKLSDIGVKNQTVYVELARQYKNQGIYDKSIEMYKKAIDLDPQCKNYISRESLEDIYSTNNKIKENQKTISLCNKLLEKYPDNIYIHFVLGNTHFLEGDPGKAIEEYKKIKDLDPACKDNYTKKACINLARAYGAAKRYDESIREYENLSKNNVYMDTEAFQFYAQSYFFAKDYDKAIEVATRGLLHATNYDIKRGGLYKVIAISYLKKNNNEEGLKYLRLAVEADPKDEKAKEILDRIERNEKWDEENRWLECPDNVSFYNKQ